MFEYLPELMKGLHTSLTLTVASLIVALILALIFTIILTLKTPVLVWLKVGPHSFVPRTSAATEGAERVTRKDDGAVV